MIKDTFGSGIYILHTPGVGKERGGWFLQRHIENLIHVSDKITVLTTATDDVLDKCPLIKQLNYSGIPYLNSAKYYKGGEWLRVNKLSLISKAMGDIITEYTLVVDANDVVILKDLDNDFIDKWKQYNCNILYNAGQYRYPKDLSIAREDIEWDNINNMNIYTNHYLNAGVCFGKTDIIKEFYKSAYDVYESAEYPHMDSEQYYIKLAYAHRYDIKIDNGCHLFLCSHAT